MGLHSPIAAGFCPWSRLTRLFWAILSVQSEFSLGLRLKDHYRNTGECGGFGADDNYRPAINSRVRPVCGDGSARHGSPRKDGPGVLFRVLNRLLVLRFHRRGAVLCRPKGVLLPGVCRGLRRITGAQ